jgi:hypothetical protein
MRFESLGAAPPVDIMICIYVNSAARGRARGTHLERAVADLGPKVKVALGRDVRDIDWYLPLPRKCTDLATEVDVVNGSEDHVRSVDEGYVIEVEITLDVCDTLTDGRDVVKDTVCGAAVESIASRDERDACRGVEDSVETAGRDGAAAYDEHIAVLELPGEEQRRVGTNGRGEVHGRGGWSQLGAYLVVCNVLKTPIKLLHGDRDP